MLEFERTVAIPGREEAVHVFVDAEKGHVVYLSHTGMLNVVEKEQVKNSKVRAAGFAAVQSSRSDCSGC